MKIVGLHHIAIICSNYEKSKHFYSEILGFEIINEFYRNERESYKLDLSLNGNYLIELFSFSNPPQRLTRPEATGLRHICFGVANIEIAINYLRSKNIVCEEMRKDDYTKKNTFFSNPDNLPIEIY
jgi:glyoxylase I family protein